jgi:hypothetical protein
MDWERFSNDQVEEILAVAERKFSEGRALQISALAELDRRQVFTADGCRNLSEWTASRLDVGSDTARTLVRTMRRTADKPWIRQALAAGSISFDRAEGLSRISENVGTLDHLDISGVRREAADRVELGSENEIRSAEDRYLIIQPSLDESWWTLRGGFDGITGAVIDQALTRKADDLPELPDGSRGSLPWRKATALYQLASGGESPQAQVTVFVDAEKATPTNGRAGVRLLAGPRVGAQALEAILCNCVTEVTVNGEDGTPMVYGRTKRFVPPSLNRSVLARTSGHCEIDGCDSTYRVEIHHRTPWSQGGKTNPKDLIALCWFHHHIVIHEQGFQIYKHPKHGRIRLRKPNGDRTETMSHSHVHTDQNRQTRTVPPPEGESGLKPEG